VAAAGQTRPRSVLTVPSGKPRDRRRQQVWLNRLRDVHLVARRERPPLIIGAGVCRRGMATNRVYAELGINPIRCHTRLAGARQLRIECQIMRC